jgi:hypothetical protein
MLSNSVELLLRIWGYRLVWPIFYGHVVLTAETNANVGQILQHTSILAHSSQRCSSVILEVDTLAASTAAEASCCNFIAHCKKELFSCVSADKLRQVSSATIGLDSTKTWAVIGSSEALRSNKDLACTMRTKLPLRISCLFVQADLDTHCQTFTIPFNR